MVSVDFHPTGLLLELNRRLSTLRLTMRPEIHRRRQKTGPQLALLHLPVLDLRLVGLLLLQPVRSGTLDDEGFTTTGKGGRTVLSETHRAGLPRLVPFTRRAKNILPSGRIALCRRGVEPEQ